MCVTCSQSHRGGTKLRSNLCELNVNRKPRNNDGFPLKVTVCVKRQSTKITSSFYIIDHKAEYTFWISYDSIHVSNDVSDILSKIILLMNVPFSLDVDKLENKEILISQILEFENKEILISKILEFSRTAVKNFDTYINLDIIKSICIHNDEFMEIYNNMDINYNLESSKRARIELYSRIAKFEALREEVRMKKMRFEASIFKGSNLSDTCSICWEEFSTGSKVSCIDKFSHVYRELCILEWFFRSRSCPYCRKNI
ncbi:hypothetical protein MTR67_006473 [Solanum verrucosum]|uniref:RING-type domain-containing protein n=1 Tax=Solanum verrucosum TaxID=315347 RepID=A0AAF0TDN8_SOLVR|nr:hypothetical protein MTR67_006473 [Solanum verrucosum]